jgi:hypothetical protein
LKDLEMPLPRLDRVMLRAATGTMLGVLVWYSGVRGNDTGGIIPWRPGAEHYALVRAASHCMRYEKYAVITSVHPWPGDYIGFVCRRAKRWGPMYR